MIQKLTDDCCNCTASARGPNVNGLNLNAPDLSLSGGIGSIGGSLDTDSFKWPGIDEPGFPTLIAGCLGANLAGLNLILDFVPIKFDDNGMPKIPEIPGIDIFVKAFTGSAIGLPKLSATNINFPGIGSIPIPDIPGVNVPDVDSLRLDGTKITVPGFNPELLLKLICVFIAVPFLIIKGLIDGIASLDLKLPTLDSITGFFTGGASLLGLDFSGFNICIKCIAEAILNLVKMILPI